MSDDSSDHPFGPGVTPKLIEDVSRAFFDPMIGGWPLIHWEWIFCLDPASRSITVTGEWPDSPQRQVILNTETSSRELDEGLPAPDETEA
jgi:hypothetical protein